MILLFQEIMDSLLDSEIKKQEAEYTNDPQYPIGWTMENEMNFQYNIGQTSHLQNRSAGNHEKTDSK